MAEASSSSAPFYTITLNPAAPIVLLDWSFIVFWRFFATKSWFVHASRAQNDAAVDTEAAATAATAAVTDDASSAETLMDAGEGGLATPAPRLADSRVFVESFTRSFVKAVDAIRKKHGAPKGNVVALMDAPRATLWRKAVLPTYKDNRDLKKSPIERDFFVIAEDLQAHMGVQGVRMANLEADDLAYLFKRRLASTSAKKVIMITDDNDWGQLACDGIRVVNVVDKDIGVRCGMLQQKILCGDPGDNIPPAFKRCGKATAARYAGDSQALEAFFEKNPDARKTFERNRLLIDLSCIPQKHVDAFDAAVTFLILPI